MRCISLISFLFTLVFASSLYAAEKLNILGLTLDMTIEELYKKIEQQNKKNKLKSNKKPRDNKELSVFKLSEKAASGRNPIPESLIVATSTSSNTKSKPLKISRLFYFERGKRFTEGDMEGDLIEKYGSHFL